MSNMSGYTKLFSTIVGSTIWREPDHVRLVWITMLATSNQYGDVECSVPGLADFARVTREECDNALLVLSAPDEDSRTKTDEGRRIEAIDGGWRIINHHKYRQKMSEDDRREYKRKKMREYRARDESVDKGGQMFPPLTHTEADTDTDTKAEARNDVVSRPLISGEGRPGTWGKIHGGHITGFCDWVCLPEFLFGELTRKSDGAEYVRGWALKVRGEWEGRTVGDGLRFWRARWEESHPTGAPSRKQITRTAAEIIASMEKKGMM